MTSAPSPSPSSAPGYPDLSDEIPALQDLVWALVAGCVATLLGGYIFGEGNQWAHLVQIYRHIDPGYLPGDWFADVSQQQSVRVYYTMGMAALLRVFPAGPTFLALTVLSNAGIAFLTVRASRAMFSGAGAEARWAAALAVGVYAFGAGGATHLSRHFFEPALAARVFALAAVIGIWCSRPLLAIAAGALAIALQALVGVETVALATLSLCGAAVWIVEARRKAATALLVSAVLAGWTLWLWADFAVREGAAAQATTILARVRAPHHFLPSSFEPVALAALAVFFVAAGVAWAGWSRHAARPEIKAAVVVLMALIAALCVAGWVFVELIPTRIALMAHTFRLTYLLKWVGFLLIAANAGRWWRQSESSPSRAALRAAAALSVLSFGKFYAVGVLAGQCLGLAAERHSSRFRGIALPAVVTIAAAALMASSYGARVGEPIVAWLLIATTMWATNSGARRLRSAAIPYALVLAIAFGAMAARRSTALQSAARFARVRPPIVTLEEGERLLAGLREWVRDSTSANDVFIVPPDLGQFRLRAERPIVVDFKGVGFSAPQLVAWYERMRACCLPPGFEGPGSASAFRAGYRLIDDARLERLSARYGARYAVLLVATRTDLPVLYADAHFKIVGLPPTAVTPR